MLNVTHYQRNANQNHNEVPSHASQNQFTSAQFSCSVRFSSVTQSCMTLHDPMNRSTPGLPVHHQFPEFTQTHVHRVSDASSHLNLCRPLLLLPPIPPSIRIFSNESTLRMRWPKYWSFSFSIIPSKEIPALSRRTFVGKLTSLFLNMLSRLVITFLPRSKCLLISWLKSPSAVILEPPKMVFPVVMYA